MSDPGNPIEGLYPQPSQAQPGLLSGDPLRAIYATSALQGIRAQQAQQSVGQAIQGAIDPSGNLDTAKAMAAIGEDPTAAFGAAGGVQAMLAARHAQIENETARFNLMAGQNGYVLNLLGTAADDPNLSSGGVSSLASTLSRTTNIPTSTINAWTAGLPTNPAQLKKALVGYKNAAIGAAGTSERVNGPAGPNGEQTQTNVGAANYGPPVTATGNPLGAEASATAYNAALMHEANYGQEMYPMQKALSLVQQLGPGGTGPGAAGRNNFSSFINSLAPASLRGWIPGVDPKSIQTFDEFNKYVTQAAQTRAASFGAHTDQQLATTLSGNPSSHISDLANADVLRANIALRNMQRVQSLAAVDRGGNLGFNRAAANLAGELDPRAFLLPMLGPDQIASLNKNMPADERIRFNHSIDLGIQYHAINPASLKPQAPAGGAPAAGGQ